MEVSSMQCIRRVICGCVLIVALCGEAAYGQVSSAQLSGAVTDNSGAVIAGAHVTVLNTGTGATRGVESNPTGDFIVPALDPGTYTMTVEAPGFEKAVNTVTLTVGDKKSLKIPLVIGAATQSVTVSSSGELINTTSADISTVVDQAEVQELPLNGRDPSSLVLLTTGVSNVLSTSAGAVQAAIPTETAASAGGGRQGSTYYLLDGVPNMDTYIFTAAPFPNADATQEFRVISNNYGAQYGFAPSAVVSIQTRSGTDRYHGSLFEFLRNNALNAGNYFTGLVDPLKRNQFGGAFGGPIVKKKLFFFVNYQATRSSLASSTNTTFTPTAAMLQGDFSAVPQTLGGPFQTANGKPNQVDPALFSPGALAMASVMPQGQDASTGEVFYRGPAYRVTYDEGTGRVDYSLSRQAAHGSEELHPELQQSFGDHPGKHSGDHAQSLGREWTVLQRTSRAHMDDQPDPGEFAGSVVDAAGCGLWRRGAECGRIFVLPFKNHQYRGAGWMLHQQYRGGQRVQHGGRTAVHLPSRLLGPDRSDHQNDGQSPDYRGDRCLPPTGARGEHVARVSGRVLLGVCHRLRTR